MGGAGCVGGMKMSGWGVSWTNSELSASMLTSGQLRPRTRGGIAQDAGTRDGTFHGKMNRYRESQAGLRHAVVCPNVTERTKYRIAQSKRAHAGLLVIVD